MQHHCDIYNATPGGLRDYDCPQCLNKGFVAVVKNGELIHRMCRCREIRSSMRRINAAGLGDTFGRYTFDSYTTTDDSQRKAKDAAMNFTNAPAGRWFYISGRPGSGKTHLCTAIAARLIQDGRAGFYLRWRSDAPRLKALINDRNDYESEMQWLIRTPVLYIDDLFKGSISEGDKNLAFEIIDGRYSIADSITVISTERSIKELLALDEAIARRIWERSEGYRVNAPNANMSMAQ